MSLLWCHVLADLVGGGERGTSAEEADAVETRRSWIWMASARAASDLLPASSAASRAPSRMLVASTSGVLHQKSLGIKPCDASITVWRKFSCWHALALQLSCDEVVLLLVDGVSAVALEETGGHVLVRHRIRHLNAHEASPSRRGQENH